MKDESDTFTESNGAPVALTRTNDHRKANVFSNLRSITGDSFQYASCT